MAVRYVSLSEMNTFLGTSGEDTLITSLIEGAESIFDTLIGSETGLIQSSKTEYFRPECNSSVFYLGTYKPTSVTKINDATPGNHFINGNELKLEYALSFPTTFPYMHKIEYVSGFADISAIPSDVKTCVKYIVSGLYNMKNSQGIASYKQDLLSVNYTESGLLQRIMSKENADFVCLTATKYEIHSFYTI